MVSETSRCRDRLAHYCVGDGLDVGFGGDSITPTAINFDMPKAYTNVGSDPQHLHGDCTQLPFLSGTLDYIFSSHLIEDFSYHGQFKIIHEWLRVLKRNGVIVLYQPDQKRFEAHCAATGQGLNPNHIERDFSLESFKRRVLNRIDSCKIIHEADNCEDYSWEMVIKKTV